MTLSLSLFLFSLSLSLSLLSLSSAAIDRADYSPLYTLSPPGEGEGDSTACPLVSDQDPFSEEDPYQHYGFGCNCNKTFHRLQSGGCTPRLDVKNTGLHSGFLDIVYTEGIECLSRNSEGETPYLVGVTGTECEKSLSWGDVVEPSLSLSSDCSDRTRTLRVNLSLALSLSCPFSQIETLEGSGAGFIEVLSSFSIRSYEVDLSLGISRQYETPLPFILRFPTSIQITTQTPLTVSGSTLSPPLISILPYERTKKPELFPHIELSLSVHTRFPLSVDSISSRDRYYKTQVQKTTHECSGQGGDHQCRTVSILRIKDSEMVCQFLDRFQVGLSPSCSHLSSSSPERIECEEMERVEVQFDISEVDIHCPDAHLKVPSYVLAHSYGPASSLSETNSFKEKENLSLSLSLNMNEPGLSVTSLSLHSLSLVNSASGSFVSLLSDGGQSTDSTYSLSLSDPDLSALSLSLSFPLIKDERIGLTSGVTANLYIRGYIEVKYTQNEESSYQMESFSHLVKVEMFTKDDGDSSTKDGRSGSDPTLVAILLGKC